MGEPVQQGSGEAFRAEDLSPLVEGQVGGDQDGALLVALAEDLEEQFRAGSGKGDEAQLVDDQQVEPRASCFCKFSSRLSSRASMSSWTKAAAVVKPTDNPR